MTLRITVVMVALAAAVVTLVWVPSVVPASGDGPGSTGGPVGGTTEGGGSGLTTPGDVPQTSALWSATVGGTTRTGLDTDSVGSILHRGTKRLMQLPTITGESRAQEVCQGFPEITVSQAGSSNAPGGGIKLGLDFEECVVRVDELTRTNIGVFSAMDEDLTVPAVANVPTRRTVKYHPIAWRSPRSELYGTADEFGLPSIRRSQLVGAIEDRAAIDLSRVEINRSYRLGVPLEAGYYRKRCRAINVFPDHIIWFNDECLGNQSVVAGQVRAWARGRFRAVVRRDDTSLNRDSRHTIYLRLEGTANGDVTKSCTFSPYGIRHLEATFAPSNPLFWRYPGGYGVRVDCWHRN